MINWNDAIILPHRISWKEVLSIPHEEHRQNDTNELLGITLLHDKRVYLHPEIISMTISKYIDKEGIFITGENKH